MDAKEKKKYLFRVPSKHLHHGDTSNAAIRQLFILAVLSHFALYIHSKSVCNANL